MSKTKFTKFDYVQDITGIRLDSFYGSTAVLGLLWVIGIIGLFGHIYPEITTSLYYVSGVNEPIYFVILWLIMPIEIFFKFKTIAFRLCDIYHTDPMLRILFYMMWSTLTIGFGLIFGT